jgi:hypothetical protein
MASYGESPLVARLRRGSRNGGKEEGAITGYRRHVTADFTVIDQAGEPWALSEHLDSAALLVFLRGDW